MLKITGFILLCLFMVISIISIFFSLPGTFFLFALALLYGLITHFETLGWKTYLILASLVAFGEVMEYLMTVYGVIKFGRGTKETTVGAIIGGIVGALLGVPFFFGLGALPGAVMGVFAGAFLVDIAYKKDLQQALRSGLGALFGRVAALFIKVFCAIAICVIVLSAAL